MIETEVLVIGAGPVGLLAALALSRHGVPCIVVDRRLERAQAPRAHAINPRTLEICERLGLPAETLRAIGAPPAKAGWVRFGTSLTGIEFGALPYERQQDDVLDLTPFPLSNLSQPDFEAALAGALDAAGGAALLRGADCRRIDEDAEGVRATLALRGQEDELVVRARYAIAADGAGSPTRQQLGIELEGLQDLQHNLMIHFEADLSTHVADRPGILHFLFGPGTGAVLLCFDAARSWVLMHPWDPATQRREDFDEAHCRSLVEAAVGAPVPALRIRHRSPWSMCAQVARAYRDGRIFLAGDAAHRFPPTGGLGLNTGIGDAQDIAWKLAAVLRGDADAALLDSYEAERQPVARINSEQSLTNSARLFELIAALNGPDPEKAEAHFAAVCANPDGHPAVAAAVEAQRPHFDSLALQLGYQYDSALITDPAPQAAPADISAHEPSWEPGACVPHRWIRDGAERRSLTSALPATTFCLLAGPAAQRWIDATRGLTPEVRTLREGTDFEALDEGWSARTGLPEDGALLVRPDAHICARLGTPGADATKLLTAALDRALARPIGTPTSALAAHAG